MRISDWSSDVCSSDLVLAVRLGWTFIDPLFGIGIAAYILCNAWQIASDALDMLMDRELPEEERARIRAVISAHKGVLEIHDLRTRSSGPQIFIQCHIELDGGQSLLQAHAIQLGRAACRDRVCKYV